MKVWKEIGKGAVAFAVWMLVFVLMALVDEAVGYWITDHKVTQIMTQAIIHGAAVIVLLILDAKIGTAIGLNMLLLTVMWIFTDKGMAHSMAMVMMLGIIPVYLNKKSEPISYGHEKGEWIQQLRPYDDEIKCTACGAKMKGASDRVVKFPAECSKQNCPHFKHWESGISEITCRCDLCDLDADADCEISLECPLLAKGGAE